MTKSSFNLNLQELADRAEVVIKNRAIIDKLSTAYDNREFREMLDMLAPVLKDTPIDDDNFWLYYYKAAALDGIGQPYESLAIFAELKARAPTDPVLHRSFRVCLENLQSLGARKSDNPNALEEIYKLLKAYYYVPFYIQKLVARKWVTEGRWPEAKEMLNAMLALSPYDADYLSLALDCGLAAKDLTFTMVCMKMVYAAIKQVPGELKLYPLVNTVREFAKQNEKRAVA